MRIINLYVGRQLIGTFLVTLAVLTFIFISGSFFKIGTYVGKGVDITLLFQFLGYGMPKVLGMTIPLSLLASTILVFSRLSADNEITAMRASGISIWQIVVPGLLFSVICSAFCIYLQMELIPRCDENLYAMKKSGDQFNPEALLEAGRFIEVESMGMLIYIDSIDEEDGKLRNIDIYNKGEDGQFSSEVTAREGVIDHDKANKRIDLIFEDSSINYKHTDDKKIDRIQTDQLTIPIPYADLLKGRKLFRKSKQMSLTEIFELIAVYEDLDRSTTPLYLEVHKRLALALCPFAFLLLGIPFGISTSRSETSVGMVISIGLAMLFYVFIILADNLKNSPQYRPEILIWLPNIIYQACGLIALRRISKR